MEKIDWANTRDTLDVRGYSHLRGVLTQEQCAATIRLFDDESLFRTAIDMERYRFGRGLYKYFRYPLPPLVSSLRNDFYRHLAPLASDWMARLGKGPAFPPDLASFSGTCREKGQLRPTPLLLRYEEGGYNTLHQDMYGEIFFPFQVVMLLSEAGVDFEGGESVFVEQLPRAQSRASVVSLSRGDAIIFTTNFRPVKGSKGFYRSAMKHGISTVTSGVRYALGIIFHDSA